MKRLRQLCAATVLSLTFALSTFAGEIQFPGITSQPQSAGSTSISTTTYILLTIVQAIQLP